MSLQFLIAVVLLLSFEVLFFSIVKEAVVTREGIVLNQKIPLEWEEISTIVFIPLLRFYFVRFIYHDKTKVAVFPSERLNHEVLFGMHEDNIVQQITKIQIKYFK